MVYEQFVCKNTAPRSALVFSLRCPSRAQPRAYRATRIRGFIYTGHVIVSPALTQKYGVILLHSIWSRSVDLYLQDLAFWNLKIDNSSECTARHLLSQDSHQNDRMIVWLSPEQ